MPRVPESPAERCHSDTKLVEDSGIQIERSDYVIHPIACLIKRRHARLNVVADDDVMDNTHFDATTARAI